MNNYYTLSRTYQFNIPLQAITNLQVTHCIAQYDVATELLIIIIKTTTNSNHYHCIRILVQYMDEYKSDANKVTWHIPSRYNKEMSMLSEVVSE